MGVCATLLYALVQIVVAEDFASGRGLQSTYKWFIVRRIVKAICVGMLNLRQLFVTGG